MIKSMEILKDEVFFRNNLDRNEYTKADMLKIMKTVTIEFMLWLKEQHIMVVECGRGKHTYNSTYTGGPSYSEEELWNSFNDYKSPNNY